MKLFKKGGGIVDTLGMGVWGTILLVINLIVLAFLGYQAYQLENLKKSDTEIQKSITSNKELITTNKEERVENIQEVKDSIDQKNVDLLKKQKEEDDKIQETLTESSGERNTMLNRFNNLVKAVNEGRQLTGDTYSNYSVESFLDMNNNFLESFKNPTLKEHFNNSSNLDTTTWAAGQEKKKKGDSTPPNYQIRFGDGERMTVTQNGDVSFVNSDTERTHQFSDNTYTLGNKWSFNKDDDNNLEIKCEEEPCGKVKLQIHEDSLPASTTQIPVTTSTQQAVLADKNGRIKKTNNASSNGYEFIHSNGTQGIGIGYNTLYTTGSNPNQDLNLKPRGNGKVGITGNIHANGDINTKKINIRNSANSTKGWMGHNSKDKKSYIYLTGEKKNWLNFTNNNAQFEWEQQTNGNLRLLGYDKINTKKWNPIVEFDTTGNIVNSSQAFQDSIKAMK